jgi:hypothetical protein
MNRLKVKNKHAWDIRQRERVNDKLTSAAASPRRSHGVEIRSNEPRQRFHPQNFGGRYTWVIHSNTKVAVCLTTW